MIWVGALAAAACGGVEDGASLVRAASALSCQTDTDCGDGYACARFTQRNYCEPRAPSTPGGGQPPTACRSDDDCGPGEECESEHGRYYCAPHHDNGKEYYGTDAGRAPDAPQEPCRDDGEDCYTDACGDAGAYAECEDDGHHGGHDDERSDYEDRSGPNRGPH